MHDFDGACAVITGAASGIGAALARGLVARGARVALADIFGDRAISAAQALGGQAQGYGCDVTDRDELDALAAAVSRDFGRVTHVFANAGVWVGGDLVAMEPRDFEWLFEVNVAGVFNTVRAFAPHLLQAASGAGPTRFVLTGSDNSVGVPSALRMTAYSATKHAVLGLADGLRRDLDGTGVGVSLLCPGPANTRIWDARRARQSRYGGSVSIDLKTAAATAGSLAVHTQDPEVTARLCLDGVARGDFLIMTVPETRSLATKRHRDVEAALDRLDQALAAATT